MFVLNKSSELTYANSLLLFEKPYSADE